ncbi:MAG: GNAT family N-acetyltransferase [Winogradskyella sp.]|nr:GNAT family N-acetyltransferase [Winogradskyella sp.]
MISIRQNPNYKDRAIRYFQQSWKSVWPIIYEDCITHSISAKNDLPQWYLLEKDKTIIGFAGLITNDFISRGDLYPWVCGLFIDEHHRGHAYASILLQKAKSDAQSFGFKFLYLCTELSGFYEKYGFEYIGQGYHPWESESKIYQIKLVD